MKYLIKNIGTKTSVYITKREDKRKKAGEEEGESGVEQGMRDRASCELFFMATGNFFTYFHQKAPCKSLRE